MLILTYFALTTLTTIGLGDFYPIDSFERILGIFVFLIGVTGMSFIVGQLLSIMEKI